MAANQKEIPRPYKVTLEVRVEKHMTVEVLPAYAEDMGDAVERAIEEWKAGNQWDTAVVVSASVEMNE